MPSSSSSRRNACNWIIMSIIAVLSLVTLILIIVVSTKSCDKFSSSSSSLASSSKHRFTVGIEFATVPNNNYQPSIVLLIASKAGNDAGDGKENLVSKSVISASQPFAAAREELFHLELPILAVDDIGFVDVVVQSGVTSANLRSTGLKITLKRKDVSDEELMKEIKYCINGEKNHDVVTSIYYHMQACASS